MIPDIYVSEDRYHQRMDIKYIEDPEEMVWADGVVWSMDYNENAAKAQMVWDRFRRPAGRLR